MDGERETESPEMGQHLIARPIKAQFREMQMKAKLSATLSPYTENYVTVIISNVTKREEH